ncbi:MAG: type IV pilus modification protein PilV [Gammaproteobacteria bacterium]|nr:type IV pilus modification protein PilV [Gammaproteobacteria bacterium]NNF66096.1 type IV pilus modification protein PilV [Gammaproteobacteria bacterium]
MIKRMQKGFTLIEVLIAVIVLGIGLTGMAGLQIVSLRGSQQAYQRTQATIYAYDVLDRMRANVVATRNGDYDTAIDDDTSALELCFGASANCTPAEFADHDRRQWRTELANQLGGGVGSIGTVTASGETVVTINVRWIESDAAVDGNGDAIPQQLNLTVNL